MDLARILRLANLFSHVAGIGRRDPIDQVDWSTTPENPGFPGDALSAVYAVFLEEYEEERERMDPSTA